MSKRILVVEDHADNRQIIRDMLAPTDYEITEAESGEEALAAIAKQRPDLILMDVQLPTMDGYTATSRIKADPALRSIPIIAVTSYALNGEEKKARAAVMIMCPNPLAHANCWRKFAITYNSSGHNCCGA
jgi:two-component system, cell cycle response regulator DivK